jgi:hypothetical protein
MGIDCLEEPIAITTPLSYTLTKKAPSDTLREFPKPGHPEIDSSNDLRNADPGNRLQVFELTETFTVLRIFKAR